MELITNTQILKSPENARFAGGVVAIGNFDGVHKGHQELLKKTKEIAQNLGVPANVLTFEPHPKRLFRPEDAPSRITPHAMKAWRLECEGMDAMIF